MFYNRVFCNGLIINQAIKLTMLVSKRKKKHIKLEYVMQGRSI